MSIIPGHGVDVTPGERQPKKVAQMDNLKIDEKEHERRMGFARQKLAVLGAPLMTLDPKLVEAFAEILVVEMYEPHLGCATTKELIDEITARVDDLDYKTINGGKLA